MGQVVYRPEKDGMILDPEESLGACLGFQMLRTKIRGNEPTIEINLLGEEETLPQPVQLLFYSLKGHITSFKIFNADWRQSDFLLEPLVPVKTAAPVDQ